MSLTKRAARFIHNPDNLERRIHRWQELGWIEDNMAEEALESLSGREAPRIFAATVRLSVFNAITNYLMGIGSIVALVTSGLTGAALAKVGGSYLTRETIGHLHILRSLKDSPSRHRVANWYHVFGALSGIKELARTHPAYTILMLTHRNTRGIQKRKERYHPDSFLYRVNEQLEYRKFVKARNSAIETYKMTRYFSNGVKKIIRQDPQSIQRRREKRALRRGTKYELHELNLSL